MRTIHFNSGFHIFSMVVAAGVGFVVGAVAEKSQPLRDVTEMRVVGQGCGEGAERERVYIATEEDELPGPTCEVVFELVAQE